MEPNHSALAKSRFLGLLREAIVSVPLLFMAYLMVKQAGPWRWLVELQLQLLDTYFPNYTAAACLTLATGLACLVHIALAIAGWPARPVLANVLVWAIGLRGWLAVVLFVAVVIVVLGLGNLVSIRLAGERTHFHTADLEAGDRPASRWLVLSGRPLLNRPVVWTKGRDVTHRAVAWVSRSWRDGEPAMVVLYCANESKWNSLQNAREVEGIASLTGIPEMYRASLEKNGVPIADDALFLEVDQDPEKTAQFATTSVTVGQASCWVW